MKVIFLLLAWHASFAVQLQKIDINKQNKKTVITFSFSGPFVYKAFELTNPARFVVDLPKTSLSFNPGHQVKAHPLIKGIRSGDYKANVLRMVFDLHHPVKVKRHKSAQSLCIELSENDAMPKVIAAQPNDVTSVKSPVMIKRSPSKSLRDVVVIIDPGHGGKDPGAIGPTSHLEKNVVLAIGLKLKKMIDREPGMRAVLTRHDDNYVGLRERLNIARKSDGDIFISIHADAFKNKRSHGASVFALSQTGATSEAARWIAEKENYSELGGVDLSELDDKNGVIRSVLIDLSQTATIGASLQMGQNVLNSIDKITTLHHKNIEQARFVVLKSPDIPSILVETGFISNPREERNLISAAYQTKLARAILSGAKRYFFEHPPHGSRIAAMMNTKKHIVHRGETLSGIATKYYTSINELKRLNTLKNNKLIIGQRLIIPKKWS